MANAFGWGGATNQARRRGLRPIENWVSPEPRHKSVAAAIRAF
jgi:hypothetical protein